MATTTAEMKSNNRNFVYENPLHEGSSNDSDAIRNATYDIEENANHVKNKLNYVRSQLSHLFYIVLLLLGGLKNSNFTGLGGGWWRAAKRAVGSSSRAFAPLIARLRVSLVLALAHP